MHAPTLGRPTPHLWLIAGTGEGPLLAAALLERGWWLQVSVVSPGAARAYRPHPHLRLRVGAIGGESGVARELGAATRAGAPFHWVVDASHPFATRISAELEAACAGALQPLVRLERPSQPLGSALPLADLAALERHDTAGEPLLLAIGARRLAEAVRHSPLAIHHCRILPHAEALRQAMAAGLPSRRVACLRPGRDGSIERALCQQWGIRTVLCRQSGGITEARWQDISQDLGLRLLLLQRPAEPTGPTALGLERLVEQLGWPGPGP